MNPGDKGNNRFRPDSYINTTHMESGSAECRLYGLRDKLCCKQTLFWSLAALFFVFCFLMTYFTPLFTDDLSYSYYYKEWLTGRAPFPGFEPWLKLFVTHFEGINGRFGDKLLLGYLILPKAIQALMSATASLGIVVGASKLAFGSISKNPVKSTLMLLTIAIIMPWYDTMWQACMIVNYIFGSAIGLWAIYLFFRESNSDTHHNMWQYIGVLLLGFLAGSWHECLTFIMAPGILIYLIWLRRLDKFKIFLLTGLILGGVFIISCPGFWVRYDHSVRVLSMRHAENIFYYANAALLILLACPAVLSFVKLRNRYSRAEKAYIVAAAIAMLLNAFIFVSNLGMPRALWYGQLIAIVGLWIIIKPIGLRKAWRKIGYSLLIAATVFFITHMAVCVIWQIKLHREYNDIIALYMKSPSGDVFYDQTAAESLPWIAFGRTSYQQFEGWRIDHGIGAFYRTKDKLLHLTPTSLKEFTPENSQRLLGEDAIYKYNGHIVAAPIDGRILRWRKMECTYNDGHRDAIYTIVQRFKDKDNKSWEYWKIDDADKVNNIKPLAR